MRKFSKIFAALLSICLIIGAVMVFALAKSPASVVDFGKSDDFEKATAGSDYTKNFGSGSGSAGTYSSLKVVHDEKSNNNYIRFAFTKEATKRYRRDYLYAAYSADSPITLLSDYSYVTLDFDVCADQYVYEINGKTEMGTTIPEGAENVRLSYSENTNFSLDNRIYDEANGAYYGSGYTVLGVYFKYDSEVGAWRVCLGTSKPTDYYLTNNIGQWNHFTYAIKVIEKDGVYGYSQVRLYFDGNLIATSNISSANLAGSYRINPRGIDWYIGSSNSDTKALTLPYSMGIDNYKPSFYQAGYTSGSAYGIDDLYDDPDQSKSIVWCEDVVYSLDYAAPGSPYISIDTGSTKYYSPLAKDIILQKIKNGTIIETGMDILDFTPPENVDTFEVYLMDNASFSLSKEAQQKYVQEFSALGYRISKISNDDAIVINWFDSEGGQLVKSELLTANTVPSFGANSVAIFDFENGAILESSVNGWLWDIDGDGNAELGLDNPAEPIRALTPTEINIVKQYCNGVLDIYPAETEVNDSEDLAYAIEYSDANGNKFAMVDVNGSYDAFKDINTFAENVNAAPNGAIIHVYENGSVYGDIVVGKGIELSIDLGGKSLDFGNYGFILSNDSDLKVYSSLVGGSLEFGEDAIAFSTVGGSQNFNNCAISLGGEANGENLSINATKLFNITTASATSNDNKTISISIEAKEVIGSFDFAASDIEVSIKNTVLGGRYIFHTESANSIFTAIEANVTIENSTIEAEALVAEWCEGAVLNIADSKISASVSSISENDGSIILGYNNEFVRDVRCDFVTTIENVGFAIADYAVDTFEDNIKLITFAKNAEEIYDDVTLVIWNDANEDFFASEYYHSSVSVANSPKASDMTDTKKFPIVDDLNNGWFDIGYTSWVNNNNGSMDDVIAHGEKNIFIPLAEGPVASIDFMVNASLRTTEIGLNIYVKKPLDDSNIIVDISDALYYYDDEGNIIGTTLLTGFAGAEDYYAYELPLALDSFDARYGYIEFMVKGYDGNGDGNVEDAEWDYIKLRKYFSIDFMVYAETVAEIYACGTDETKLIFDLVQYKYNAYLTACNNEADDDIIKKVNDVLLSHGENCKCASALADLDFSDAEKAATLKDNAALDGVIIDTIVDLGNGKPAIYFYVDSAVDVQSLTIKFKGLEHQLGGWDYINNKITTDLVAVGTEEINGVECVVYEYQDILLCNAAAILNVSLNVNTVDEAGEPVVQTLTGAWSLASYIEESDNSMFAKSLYAASISALEYRFIRDGE